MKQKNILFVLAFILLIATLINAQTKTVYLVLGSDTAIWDNMSTGTYVNHYNSAVYTDALANGYAVMADAFRNRMKDSYNQKMKYTWWMMAGNIFRYADNRNMPIPNIMTLYFMKKYHGNSITKFGDELTLHYHTFDWFDYNGDGKKNWNQAESFLNCKDDFNFTLSQFLLEENVFPVSFRSGWHYMDNIWQNYIDQLFPFSMHNAYPSKSKDTLEPIDNSIDWSKAPSTWVPYHPSSANYQLPGALKGYNLRSLHIGSVSKSVMDTMFARANRGQDQMACLWGHLPEEDFLTNSLKVDSLAHLSESKYNGVKFRYCTAIEAMQRWLGTTDTVKPIIQITEVQNGDNVKFVITSNEILFQENPFFCAKNINEDYFVIPLKKISQYAWESKNYYKKNSLVKVGVAAIDLVGNLTTQFITYIENEIYIDNKDANCTYYGTTWNTYTHNDCWDKEATYCNSPAAMIKINLPFNTIGYNNIFYQIPNVPAIPKSTTFKFYKNNVMFDSVIFDGPIKPKDWVLVKNIFVEAGNSYFLTISSTKDSLRNLSFDVLKINPIIPQKRLVIKTNFIELGSIIKNDTTKISIEIENSGSEIVNIYNIYTSNPNIKMETSLPLQINPFTSQKLQTFYIPKSLGIYNDTIFIVCDDLLDSLKKIIITSKVENYFVIIDNEDSLNYQEYGNWTKSVAQAYGPTSRYLPLAGNKGGYANFTIKLKYTGKYDLLFIVPVTVNGCDSALYRVLSNGIVIDSLYKNQNTNSGNWNKLMQLNLTQGVPYTLQVMNDGVSLSAFCLRADAVKFALIEEINSFSDENEIVSAYKLSQNYPNPFNPVTTINYEIPTSPSIPLLQGEGRRERSVSLKIYDILGRVVETLIDAPHQPGRYSIQWNASKYASGIYYYELKAGEFRDIKKMMLVK